MNAHSNNTGIITAGTQINFNLIEDDLDCCRPVHLSQSAPRRQIEKGAQDGCSRCRLILACISWAVSRSLVSDQYLSVRTVFGGNLQIYNTENPVSSVDLQCWRRRMADPSEQDQEPTEHMYGMRSSWTVSNAECSLLPRKTSSRSTFAFIGSQLKYCTSNHHECNLVDVERRAQSLHGIRFLLIQDTTLRLSLGVTPARYACLSHCWGVEQSIFRSTQATFAEFTTKGIPLMSLPKTFRDAIRVCRNLKIAYIWIDSLCIIQNDADDWQYQAARMADVYQNAHLTIAASKSRNSAGGCFGKVDRAYRGQPLPEYPGTFIRRIPPTPLDQAWLSDDDDLGKGTSALQQDWPLLDRAWVFQEMLLSRRTVYFGINEVIWQCTTDFKQQGTRIPLYLKHKTAALPMYRVQSKGVQLSDLWHMVVVAYSNRKLTVPDDRLPAIGAIAKQMSDVRCNDTYLAGLWKNTLVADLAWSFDKQQKRDMDTEPRIYVPTWSWGHMLGPVGWGDLANGRHFKNVQVLGAVCKTEGSPFTGRISQAAISMEAPLIPLTNLRQATTLENSETQHSTALTTTTTENNIKTTGKYELVLGKTFWDHDPTPNPPFETETFALPLQTVFDFMRPDVFDPWTVTALMIQKLESTLTTDASYRKERYKRVGLVHLMFFREEDDCYGLIEHVESLETRVVTLV